MKHAAMLAVLVAFPMAAPAQSSAPRTIADCEKIKNDMAYNECLASFGPRVGERPRGSASVGDEEVEPERGRNTMISRRGRGGRQAASFEVRGGGRGSSLSLPPAWRPARRSGRGER